MYLFTRSVRWSFNVYCEGDLRGASGGEECPVVKLDDMLLPFLAGLLLGVDVLDVVVLDLVDAIDDPAALDCDGCSWGLLVKVTQSG